MFFRFLEIFSDIILFHYYIVNFDMGLSNNL